MVREFSEEKRQEIFRMLDEIDQREWKSFMEWCGSRAEEFGDWPDKLAVSAYTRYVDEYHEKVLEINEMTRQQVNTVFENVAEIDARYAARMRECQEKIKGQIAIVRTMTEFMDSMADGKPNMALLSDGSVNKAVARAEGEKIKNKEINPPNHGREGNSESQIADATLLEEEIETGTINLPEVNNTSEISNEEMEILEKYVNENVLGEVLGWDLDAAKVNLGDNFIEDMRALMLEYGLTDERSIILFLMTSTHECSRGCSMTEFYDDNWFDNKSYTINTRGAGLIQVTGSNQQSFLQYVYDHSDDDNEKAVLEQYLKGFENSDEPSKENPCDNKVIIDGQNVCEYIASNYAIEASLWYWCNNERKIIIDGDGVTINACIEKYGSEKELDIMFLASQCAVAGSEFHEEGTGRLFIPENPVWIYGDKIYVQFCRYPEVNPERETHNSRLPMNWDQREDIYNDSIEYFAGLLTSDSLN